MCSTRRLSYLENRDIYVSHEMPHSHRCRIHFYHAMLVQPTRAVATHEQQLVLLGLLNKFIPISLPLVWVHTRDMRDSKKDLRSRPP